MKSAARRNRITAPPSQTRHTNELCLPASNATTPPKIAPFKFTRQAGISLPAKFLLWPDQNEWLAGWEVELYI